jgi:hypothetical protein
MSANLLQPASGHRRYRPAGGAMAARHRRPRPEQRPTFVLTLQAMPGVDGTRVLRWLLKVLLRKHKLRCISIEERAQS